MPDGQHYCVYHGRMSDNPEVRVVLMDPLRIEEDGKLVVDGPSVAPQTIVVR